MGILTYFLFLVPSVLVALCLRALVCWLTANWRPASESCLQNLLRAILRALPWALAFAPTLLMKRGFGVMIPASLFLGGAAYEGLFGARPFDTEEAHNLKVATTSLVVLWTLLTFILFVRQAARSKKKSEM